MKEDTSSGSYSPPIKAQKPEEGMAVRQTAASGISASPRKAKDRDANVISVHSDKAISIASSGSKEERLRALKHAYYIAERDRRERERALAVSEATQKDLVNEIAELDRLTSRAGSVKSKRSDPGASVPGAPPTVAGPFRTLESAHGEEECRKIAGGTVAKELQGNPAAPAAATPVVPEQPLSSVEAERRRAGVSTENASTLNIVARSGEPVEAGVIATVGPRGPLYPI